MCESPVAADSHVVQGAAMPGKDRGLLFAPYELVAFVGLVTSLLVAVFYSLGALQNERRDRSSQRYVEDAVAPSPTARPIGDQARQERGDDPRED